VLALAVERDLTASLSPTTSPTMTEPAVTLVAA
jgi:hypothetical protein